MRTRALLVQGGLAVVGVCAAWATWQRPVEHPSAEVTVVDVPMERLSVVRYETGGRWVELRREPDGRVLATLSASAAVFPLGAGPGGVLPDGGTLTPLVAASPERTLRANHAAVQLLQRMAPLRAHRSLGVLGAERLAAVGLDAAAQRLVLDAGGRTHTFSVSTAVLGLNSPYARNLEDGRVYLLGSGLLAELDAAQSRLVDRRLHDFRPADFDTVVVQRGSSRRAFLQRAEGGGPPRLFPEDARDTADALVTTWHDRVWRAASVELLGRGELPGGGEPRVEVRLEYSHAGRSLGFLELASGKNGEVLARSEHLVGWAVLSSAVAPLLEESTRVVARGK
ncbi:MAG: DUF4340 domain-containing protein [Myxococcaceae bacterium]|nr:DUF4340 domain-containing protein [Myxococcaceae bacterium]